MPLLKDEASGFVPTETCKEIVKEIARGSSILRLSKVVSMKSDKQKIPVMSEGAGAYWVGEGERIQTSKPGWIFPELEAKKLAVIIPVTKEKKNDSTIDLFNELKESIAEAFYKAIDSAAIFGIESPFLTNILTAAKNAENLIERGTNKTLDLDVSDMFGLIEEDGFDVNGIISAVGIKNDLRKLRDANGNALFVPGTDQNEFYSQPIEFSRNNAWDKTKAEMVAGDFAKSLVGIRQGMEYEVLNEATLQNTTDKDGKPISLAEQDLIGLKCTMRIGYLVVKENAFAALVPKTA